MPARLSWNLRLAIVFLAGSYSLAGADPTVAVVTAAINARLVRSNDNTELKAVAGDLLFSGDALLISSGTQGSVEFTMCPVSGPSIAYRLGSGRAIFGAASSTGSAVKVGEGAPCALPELEQNPAIAMMEDRSLDEARAGPPGASDLSIMNPADRASWQAASVQAQRNPGDLVAKLTRVALLQKYKLDEFAVSDLLTIASQWKDEQWARTLGYTIESRKAPTGSSSGTLYAALIGISHYEDKRIRSLKYAASDAGLFNDFLNQLRAESFAPHRMVLKLIDQQAKFSAVETTLKKFLASAQAGDSVLLYIAAHGIGPNDKGNGYVVLFDTKLEADYHNSWRMDDIKQLFLDEAGRVRHAFLFVDTCHANNIGSIQTSRNSDAALSKTAQVITNGKVLAMYASSTNGLSYESARFGGGHGAFTFFLMRALNIRTSDPEYRDADDDGDGYLQPDELANYVYRKVYDNTRPRQMTNQFQDITQFAISTKPPGLMIPPCCKNAPRTASTVKGAADGVLRDPAQPSDSRSVEWTPPTEVLQQASYEEESQQVLYKYLQGEETPPNVADYQRGLAATGQALNLAGGSLFLEARAEFFEGRIALFGASYDEAIAHLEKAIRMDPASPYSYNALGMALLELRRYDEARRAFEDAIRRAPYWAYPRHNLGLFYLQRGDYAQAVATYKQAELLNPNYSYLPYNLGLIYQRLNDTDNAIEQYNLALKHAPSRAAPLVALGSLMADSGRAGKAREYYRRAADVLSANPERNVIINLRHNEAALDARTRGGLDRAIALWRQNIAEDDYIPSRFALARAFAKSAGAHNPDALNQSIAEYSQLVAKLPANTQARVEYAGVLYRARRIAEARSTLEDGIRALQKERKSTRRDPVLETALDRLNAGHNPSPQTDR